MAPAPAKRAEWTPGRSAERARGDPRIVGDHRAADCRVRGARLDQRVVGEGLAGLRRQLDLGRQAATSSTASRISASSRSLWSLRVATTRRGRSAISPAGSRRRPRPGLARGAAIAGSARPRSWSSEARETGRPLGGRLDLDQPAVAGHDDVGVDLGARVLGVVEVAEQLAADDAAGDRRDRAGERVALELAALRAAPGSRAAGRRSRR